MDTTFLGVNQDVGWYEERCRSCSSCVLGMTGGICPVTMCAKGLYNGPCGGTNLGSCEIHRDQPCAWFQIYERLALQDRLDSIKAYEPITKWNSAIASPEVVTEVVRKALSSGNQTFFWIRENGRGVSL